MQRISVIGTIGAGKTTFARQISQRLLIPHIEFDSLRWEPNWVEIPNDLMRERVLQALSGDSWVIDGNGSKVRDIIWSKADTIIWLDYSFSIVMSRLIWRVFKRVVTQQQVHNGNRETWKMTFSRDSVIVRALTNYQKNRRVFPQLFTQPEYSYLKIVHLRSPKAAQNWLSTLV